MYPDPLRIPGLFEISVWNAVLLLAMGFAYPLFLWTLARLAIPRPSLLALRWLAIVYLAALAAQGFAYLVDAHTTLQPPGGVSRVAYFLDPLAGPKTLYGVILLLPVIASLTLAPPWRPAELGRALDALTPAMLLVLALCRIGCFLQGCCYGVHSELLGVSFPVGGAVYWHQRELGLIGEGENPLPVLATQLFEAAVLGLLLVWTVWQVVSRNAGRGAGVSAGIFLPTVLVYSTARFVLEFLRDDPERNALGPLSTSQWVALGVCLLGAAMFARARDGLAAGDIHPARGET